MLKLMALALLVAGCGGGEGASGPDAAAVDPRAKACPTWLDDRAGFRYVGGACTIVTAELEWAPFSIDPTTPRVYGGWIDGGPTGMARESIHAEQTAFETFAVRANTWTGAPGEEGIVVGLLPLTDDGGPSSCVWLACL
ncbi:MAG: hypothetical protein SFX73_38570 [Kofleriaceae bacterium]|nr:hypothetical protein [Kofleriaceae bacterium]